MTFIKKVPEARIFLLGVRTINFDLVIKDGLVVDGTGRESFPSDVGVLNDKIVHVGQIDLGDSMDCQVIDARGKYVLPGFIDTHSHADCSVFLYPDCESYLRQGITTFIGGQCGDSNAPINNYWMRKYWEYDLWNDIDPFVFTPQTIQPVQKVIDVVYEKTGYRIGWKSFSDYFRVVETSGIGCNMITLAGHSQIRADVMGLDEARRPTSLEMGEMKEHLAEAFDAGVWGFSTGRDYPPSAYADFDEILELARYVKSCGGYYFTHWRRTGPRIGTPRRPNKLEGILEALQIGLEAGIKTQVSHLSTGFDVFPPDPQMDVCAAEITLRHIDDYISRGADVAFDVIPGTSGGICTTPFLASRFIPWIKQSGSLAQFVRNLKAKDYRQMLISYLQGGKWYSINPVADECWDKKIFITVGPEDYAGKDIREIAREKAVDPLEAVVELMIECPRIGTMSVNKTNEEVSALLKHDRGFVCTDTYAFDLHGMYGEGMELAEVLPHPHTYCAFPKYILAYAEGGIEETVRKLTGAPAEFMGISGRGVIREGNYADLLVLDRDRLKTNENYVEPRVYPEGIDYVVVNGKVAVDRDGCTCCRSGRILKK